MVTMLEILYYRTLVDGCIRTIKGYNECIVLCGDYYDNKVKFFERKLKEYKLKLSQLEDDYGNEMYDKMKGN